MAARRRVFGGPHDGRNATALRQAWAYIDADGRCYGQPGAGRALYVNAGEAWTFPGFGAHPCPGCAALLHERGPCPLCGHGKSRGRRRAGGAR